MKSVYAFDNYREFLQSVFDAKRASQSGFSQVLYSKFLGFNSGNYAALIMAGKRDLTVENIQRIGSALKMTFDEVEYLDSLVHRDQAKSELVRSHYSTKLKNLRKLKPRSTARASASALAAEAYFPVGLLALHNCEKENAAESLRAHVDLDSDEANKFVQSLLRSNLLVEGTSRYELNYSHQIFHDAKSTSLKHKKFLQSQLEVSKRAIESTYESGGRFYSHTFTISKEDFAYYESLLRDLISQITTRSDETAPEEIIQLNMQLFRATKAVFRK